jgi:hypothetical protein
LATANSGSNVAAWWMIPSSSGDRSKNGDRDRACGASERGGHARVCGHLREERDSARNPTDRQGQSAVVLAGRLEEPVDHTRPERVFAAALDPANQLWDRLEPPPPTRGGLAAWCRIAARLEAWNDRAASPNRPP